MSHRRRASLLAMAALAAILLPSLLTAQITFQRTYGELNNDYGYSVEQTTDGGYVITGSTWADSGDHGDVYLVKTDALGDTAWNKTYGESGFEKGYSVRQTADSGFLVVGYSFPDSGTRDVFLLRTDCGGDTLWTRTYGGANADRGYSGQQTADGGFVLTGYTCSQGAGGCDAYIVKTDALGETLWTRTFGGLLDDFARSVQQTGDSGYVITGATSSRGAGSYDVYLIKTDADGDTLWTRTFGDTAIDVGNSVRQTADGGYIVAGYTWSSGAGREDLYLIKTDANGDALWTRTCGGESGDVGYSVEQTADGGCIVAGATSSIGAGGADVYLVKVDSNGDTLWTRTFGGAADDSGYSIRQTTDGGYVVAGTTWSFGAGGCDVYLIKTDSLGNVAVAEPKASPAPKQGISLTCEPNPCRSSTVLHLTTGPLDHSTTLRIFDSQGRLVHSSSGIRASSFPLDMRSMAAGAYFLCLDAGDRHATTRLVLQR